MMLRECDHPTVTEADFAKEAGRLSEGRISSVARLISYAENHLNHQEALAALESAIPAVKKALFVGITGTGGAGKSSLTDELIRRFLHDHPESKIAVLSVDPTKQKTGGALLGDRIRMNAIFHPNVFMRSLATRASRSELSLAIHDAIRIVKAAGFDLILIETSGIGQGDAEIMNISDVAMYV